MYGIQKCWYGWAERTFVLLEGASGFRQEQCTGGVAASHSARGDGNLCVLTIHKRLLGFFPLLYHAVHNQHPLHPFTISLHDSACTEGWFCRKKMPDTEYATTPPSRLPCLIRVWVDDWTKIFVGCDFVCSSHHFITFPTPSRQMIPR